MEQWLVRTVDNWITGPFPKEQIQEMILDRRLTSQDEVCSAHGYWISIHEVGEVKQQLGVDVPRPLLVGEENEETTTQVQSVSSLDPDITDPDFHRPTESEERASQDGTTAVFKMQPKKQQIQRVKSRPLPRRANGVSVVGRKPKSSKAVWVLLVLLGLFCSGVFLKSKGFFK